MPITFSERTLSLNGHSLKCEWPILSVVEHDVGAYVLLNPDAYLMDPTYKTMRRVGTRAIHNLISVAANGRIVWSAQIPESADYYYKIATVGPLVPYSFSSHRCVIRAETGEIDTKEFIK